MPKANIEPVYSHFVNRCYESGRLNKPVGPLQAAARIRAYSKCIRTLNTAVRKCKKTGKTANKCIRTYMRSHVGLM